MSDVVDQITWLQNNQKSQAAVIGQMQSQIATLTAQRDEALAACRDVHNYFWNPDVIEPILSEGDVQEMVEAALAQPEKPR